MACPTCSHTMACLYSHDICRPIFHCETCGTIVAGADTYVPKLVTRCREFERVAAPGTMRMEWQRLIVESIHVLEDRKP